MSQDKPSQHQKLVVTIAAAMFIYFFLKVVFF